MNPSRSILFRGMNEQEVALAMKQLEATHKEYKKGETILTAGDKTDRMGMILDGSVTIENNDLWGNRTILSHVSVGQFFAETYAFLKDEPLLVDAVANQDCHILFLRIGLLPSLLDKHSWGIKFLNNLLSISAQKNIQLSGRSFHTSPKTIRARVMSYLNSMAIQKETTQFTIPFDRQQFADYLNVERTALSKELSKMKKEHLIDVHKNHFILYQIDS